MRRVSARAISRSSLHAVNLGSSGDRRVRGCPRRRSGRELGPPSGTGRWRGAGAGTRTYRSPRSVLSPTEVSTRLGVKAPIAATGRGFEQAVDVEGAEDEG